MWVWSRIASAKWEDAWLERLRHLGPERLVTWHVAGSRMLKLEAYLDSEREARKLVTLYGGKTARFDRAWKPDWTPPEKPIAIRGRLLLYANAEAFQRERMLEDRRIRMLIPAELAFGTGEHATTATCLRWMCDLLPHFPASWSCCDIGTGSGILAVAAARLGAGEVEAFDFDPAAVKVARRNLQRNGLKARVKLHQADLAAWQPERAFDLVCANVYGDILTANAGTIANAVAPGGQLLLSGMLRSQAPECIEALCSAGMAPGGSRNRGKWVTALLTRPEAP